MRSRAARLTLVVLFVAALGVTAYLFWMGESLARSEADAARAFDAGAHDVARGLLDVRAAQQAYVAAGQDGESWTKRGADGLASARQRIADLREGATSAQARTDLDGAESGLRDLAQLDKKIASYVRGGQNLMAADMIFADARQQLEAAVAAVDRARASELAARDAVGATYEGRQVFALTAAAAAALLAILLLAAVPEPEVSLSLAGTAPPRAEAVPRPVPTPSLEEEWSVPKRLSAAPAPAAPGRPSAAPLVVVPPVVAGPGVAEPAAETAPPAAAAAPDVPATDFAGLARLCTDLACVVDTQALPDLLDRAAVLLDASGIILWIADPDGRELNPIFAQGYAPQLVNRLGTIPRDAHNATAAAFRTSLVQTVQADPISEGAIAAPLVTPAGCVGVMAAEVRHDREKRHDTLAAAAIVAAQLATLVGPPSTKQTSVATR